MSLSQLYSRSLLSFTLHQWNEGPIASSDHVWGRDGPWVADVERWLWKTTAGSPGTTVPRLMMSAVRMYACSSSNGRTAHRMLRHNFQRPGRYQRLILLSPMAAPPRATRRKWKYNVNFMFASVFGFVTDGQVLTFLFFHFFWDYSRDTISTDHH